MTKEKKHADFQDKYRKSSNFNKVTKDVNLDADGKGNVTTQKNLNDLSDSEKKNIENAMDKMQQNIEMIPGENNEEE